MNWRGTYTLFYREVWRFLRVIIQTLFAPALTALLYLWVFGHWIGERIMPFEGVRYDVFLVPGLIMMSVIQNSFANSASSIMQSKLMGNLVFVLMAPISSFEMFIAYVGASVLRGVLVALSIYVVAMFTVSVQIEHFGLLLYFTVVCSILMGALGVVAGLWSDKVEQMAAFQNFVIMPFSFLSGVFYSVSALPPLWQQLSHFNPFFYMIDGFRYAFLGHSDVSLAASLAVVTLAAIGVSGLCWYLLYKGYKIRL